MAKRQNQNGDGEAFDQAPDRAQSGLSLEDAFADRRRQVGRALKDHALGDGRHHEGADDAEDQDELDRHRLVHATTE
ncbi:MAG: hypothetical protein M5U26_06225 [Planctomycetota bacterium]|nr:hypothetical protein [Planctomycetota bacterium]